MEDKMLSLYEKSKGNGKERARPGNERREAQQCLASIIPGKSKLTWLMRECNELVPGTHPPVTADALGKGSLWEIVPTARMYTGEPAIKQKTLQWLESLDTSLTRCKDILRTRNRRRNLPSSTGQCLPGIWSICVCDQGGPNMYD